LQRANQTARTDALFSELHRERQWQHPQCVVERFDTVDEPLQAIVQLGEAGFIQLPQRLRKQAARRLRRIFQHRHPLFGQRNHHDPELRAIDAALLFDPGPMLCRSANHDPKFFKISSLASTVAASHLTARFCTLPHTSLHMDYSIAIELILLNSFSKQPGWVKSIDYRPHGKSGASFWPRKSCGRDGVEGEKSVADRRRLSERTAPSLLWVESARRVIGIGHGRDAAGTGGPSKRPRKTWRRRRLLANLNDFSRYPSNLLISQR
jgi:hypothetical protein